MKDSTRDEEQGTRMWRACCALCSRNPWSPTELLPAVRGTCAPNKILLLEPTEKERAECACKSSARTRLLYMANRQSKAQRKYSPC